MQGNWVGPLFFMADGAFDQFGFVFAVTFLTEGMGRIFEGIKLVGHVHFAVVAGFAFINFLAVMIGNPFAIGAFAMMAGFAFQSCLVRSMRERGRFRRFGRINGGLQSKLCRAFIGGAGLTGQAGQTAENQKDRTHQRLLHIFLPVIIR